MRAGDEWFSMDLDVVRPVIKDVSNATFQVTQEVTRELFVLDGVIFSLYMVYVVLVG